MHTKTKIFKAFEMFYIPYYGDVNFATPTLGSDWKNLYHRKSKSNTSNSRKTAKKSKESLWKQFKSNYLKNSKDRLTPGEYYPQKPRLISKQYVEERCQSGSRNYSDRMLYKIVFEKYIQT